MAIRPKHDNKLLIRKDDRVVEGVRLLSVCTVENVPRVQIPLFPPKWCSTQVAIREQS